MVQCMLSSSLTSAKWIGIADGLTYMLADDDGASRLRVGMGVLLRMGGLRCGGLIGARYKKRWRPPFGHS